MRGICIFFFLIGCINSFSQKPVPIIFDTDIAPDYDDVGAMAILHAFANRGEAVILATISCNAFETTVPTLSVLNTYFGRPQIPIGVTKSSFPNKNCSQEWAQAIIKHYPHAIRSNEEAMNAISLYRKILSGQPDGSVTIISVGFFTNLSGLLGSGPDEYSNLGGSALVTKKVKRLVSMAARIDGKDSSGYEFNVDVDPPASQKVFSEWPSPIVISGFEVGQRILTGIRLVNNDSIRNSPVKDAFQIALTKDHNSVGRNSWDETAVWVAVRGYEPYFSTRKLNLRVLPDGKDILIPGEKFTWIEIKADPKEIAHGIEDLMMEQPAKNQ